jgi:ACT domain-containing protein
MPRVTFQNATVQIKRISKHKANTIVVVHNENLPRRCNKVCSAAMLFLSDEIRTDRRRATIEIQDRQRIRIRRVEVYHRYFLVLCAFVSAKSTNR